MIRSTYVISLFCFSFITSSLFCGERQNKGRKNKSAETTSATNNANVTPLVIHQQETPITPIQVTSPRNSSPLPSPGKLSRRSSAGSFTEEEPLSPQLQRSTATFQTTSSTSSTVAPVVNSATAAPAQPNVQTPQSSTTQKTTSTSCTSSTTIHTGQEASSSNVVAIPAQLVQSTSSTALITSNSNVGPRLESTWWTWAQEKTEGLRYDRTVVLTSLRNNTFRDRFHTPMLKFTKIGNAINELLVEEDKRGKDDLLLRCDELVDGAKDHAVEILAAQKRDILTRVDTKIQRLQALRAKLI